MSVFSIKLLALISMAIDHLAYVLYTADVIEYQLCVLLRSVGRLAFPLYCFLLVNGFEHTSNRAKYLSRLMLLAVLSQLPFTLAFTYGNYMPGVTVAGGIHLSLAYDWPLCLALVLVGVLAWLIFVRRDISALYLGLLLAAGLVKLELGSITLLDYSSLNVFYTLGFGLAAMSALDGLIYKELPLWKALGRAALLVCLILLLQPRADYGYIGLCSILLIWLCRDRRVLLLAAVAVMCFSLYWNNERMYLYFSLLTLLPILLYNGKLGRNMKWFFYLFYPVHLVILGLAQLCI